MKFEELLNNDILLDEFIMEAESNLQTPPRDLTDEIMCKIAEHNKEDERETRQRKRIFAIASFVSAACILLMSGFGVFEYMSKNISFSADELVKLVGTIFK